MDGLLRTKKVLRCYHLFVAIGSRQGIPRSVKSVSGQVGGVEIGTDRAAVHLAHGAPCRVAHAALRYHARLLIWDGKPRLFAWIPVNRDELAICRDGALLPTGHGPLAQRSPFDHIDAVVNLRDIRLGKDNIRFVSQRIIGCVMISAIPILGDDDITAGDDLASLGIVDDGVGRAVLGESRCDQRQQQQDGKGN